MCPGSPFCAAQLFLTLQNLNLTFEKGSEERQTVEAGCWKSYMMIGGTNFQDSIGHIPVDWGWSGNDGKSFLAFLFEGCMNQDLMAWVLLIPDP